MTAHHAGSDETEFKETEEREVRRRVLVDLRCSELEDTRWVRHKLEHENELINHRLSWLASSQSLLAAAYVVALDPEAGSARHFLQWVPVLGIVSTVFVYSSVIAAMWAFRIEVKSWASRNATVTEDVLLTGSRTTQSLGFLAPMFLPLLITGAWGSVLAWG